MTINPILSENWQIFCVISPEMAKIPEIRISQFTTEAKRD